MQTLIPMQTRIPFCVIVVLLLSTISFAVQSQSTEKAIREIQQLMLDHYVFLDKAKEVNAHLDKLLNEKYFDAYPKSNDLAQVLTDEIRKITHDRHISVRVPRPRQMASSANASITDNLNRYYQPMFNSFEYFDNNVGYIDLRFFGGGEQSWAQIDAVMKQMNQADALIIDLRKNGGGSVTTVQYFCSYFFDKHFLMNSIYTRETNHTQELWTVEVKGRKRPKVPVYFLISSRTFSGAEDFSYTLQNHGRATVIGENSGGGAHPTRSHSLSNGLRIGIPFARSIHPITKSNWEGVGVIPDVKISSDQALEKAKGLATEAALAYKKSNYEPLENILNALAGKKTKKKTDELVFSCLNELVQNNMLTEGDINRFGYAYSFRKNTTAALAILKSNTLLFPESPNAYDSYAEVLALQGEQSLALLNYQKAVELAKKQEHWNLNSFQQNLKAFQEQVE